MKKYNVVRQMWSAFVMQFLIAVCLTTGLVFIAHLLLHSRERANANFAHSLPVMRQKLQTEQDPDKLRHEAIGLLDEVVSDSQMQEFELRFLIKMALFFGFYLIICSLGYGVFAYRLQRQQRLGSM